MSERLSEETRKTVLAPLFSTGWAMVEDRDAIVKTFKFNDFADAFGWMTRAAIWARCSSTAFASWTDPGGVHVRTLIAGLAKRVSGLGGRGRLRVFQRPWGVCVCLRSRRESHSPS